MSLEVLTALAFVAGIGGLTASIVGVVTCARREAPVPPDDTPGADRPPRTWAFGWQVCWRLRIWYGVLTASVVLIILAFAALLSVIGQRETNVYIKAPDARDTVEAHTLVRGTCAHVPDGKQVWVIVKPHGEEAYYPQPEVILIDLEDEHDQWSTPTLIGAPDDGGVYDILAVLADAEAGDVLRANMTDPESDTLGPALDRLPEGVTIYEQITVVRG